MDINNLLNQALAEVNAKPSNDISDLDELLDEMQSNEHVTATAQIEQQLKAALSSNHKASYADLDSEPYEPDLSPSSIYDPDVLSFQQSILDNVETEQVLIATNEINISTIQIGETPVVIEQTPNAKLAITSNSIDDILAFALNEVEKIQDASPLGQDAATSDSLVPNTPEITVEEKNEILPTSSTPANAKESSQTDPVIEKIKLIKESFDKVIIPIDQVTLDDTNTFKSEKGIDLSKFPKQYARISTNIQKQSDWYISALEQHGDAGLQAIATINEIKQSDASLDAIQLVGNNALFGNPFGPLQKHRQLTKEELKARAIAEENAKQARLVEEAIERASQSVSPEHQVKRDKFREIISEIKSKDVMSAETARLNNILQSNRERQSHEIAVPNTVEDQKPLNVAYRPAQKGDSDNSYYAIISNDQVIATGLANNFPPALLTTMAREANGYLLWSAKPFEIDLGQFKVLSQVQTLGQETAKPDKFEAEIAKGFEQVQSSYLSVQLPKEGNSAKVNEEQKAQLMAQPEMNENIKSRISTLMAMAEEKNRVIRFYQHKRDGNSVLVVSGEGELMKFATIAKNGNLMKLPETFDRRTFASLLAKSDITELNAQEHLEHNPSTAGLAP